VNRSTPPPDFVLVAIALVSSSLGALAVWLVVSLVTARESSELAIESLNGQQLAHVQERAQTHSVSSPNAAPPPWPTDPQPPAQIAGKRSAQCPENLRSPERLSSDARIHTVHHRGRVRGFQITEVTKGSFWDAVGLSTGDIVVEMAGVPIANVDKKSSLVTYLASSSRGELTIRKADGRSRPIYWDMPESPDSADSPARCRELESSDPLNDDEEGGSLGLSFGRPSAFIRTAVGRSGRGTTADAERMSDFGSGFPRVTC
jgi:hypothetical protein